MSKEHSMHRSLSEAGNVEGEGRESRGIGQRSISSSEVERLHDEMQQTAMGHVILQQKVDELVKMLTESEEKNQTLFAGVDILL
jgi:hypothetical protein